MDVRVDDVADRLVGERADRREHFVAHAGASPVSTSSTPSLPDLHGDVAARAHQHVDVALHRQHVDFTCRSLAAARTRTGRRAQRSRAKQDGLHLDAVR